MEPGRVGKRAYAVIARLNHLWQLELIDKSKRTAFLDNAKLWSSIYTPKTEAHKGARLGLFCGDLAKALETHRNKRGQARIKFANSNTTNSQVGWATYFWCNGTNN